MIMWKTFLKVRLLNNYCDAPSGALITGKIKTVHTKCNYYGTVVLACTLKIRAIIPCTKGANSLHTKKIGLLRIVLTAYWCFWTWGGFSFLFFRVKKIIEKRVHFLGAASLYGRTNHALNIYHFFSSVMIYILLGVFLYTGDMLHGSLSI